MSEKIPAWFSRYIKTHDLDYRIKKLEQFESESKIAVLGNFDRLGELEQKLKNADDQAVANADTILSLLKKPCMQITEIFTDEQVKQLKELIVIRKFFIEKE